MWRMINKEEDPIHKNAKFHCELEVRQLSLNKCKNFKETMELISKLEKKAKDFREKIGKALCPLIMKEVLWGAMDEDTQDLAELADKDAEDKTYKEIKAWLMI